MPSSVRALAPLAALVVLGASACTPIKTHQGYMVDQELVSSIQPGVDNRESVLRTLGRPTLTGQFSDVDWYYVSRESRNLAFNSPDPHVQQTFRVTFDAAGNVARVQNSGKELIASVNPSDKKTPTLGRKRSFFDDLFGNIGTVGAPGAGPAGGGGQNP